MGPWFLLIYRNQSIVLQQHWICPRCVDEDLDKLGYFYIHRSHCIRGVNVCYKHTFNLFEYHEKIPSVYKKPALSGMFDFDSYIINPYFNNIDPKYYKYAKFMFMLMSCPQFIKESDSYLV